MSFTSMPAGGLPAKISFVAASIFIAASGAVNVTYGAKKATDLAGQITWGAVAAAVAVVFALSWPALVRTVSDRQWGGALVAVIALVLSGGYSVTAALGSASGNRTDAAAIESAATGARKRAEADHAAAKADLAKLGTARPVGEVEALLASARPVCRVVVADGNRTTTCGKPPALEAELARAKQRERLQAVADKASAALETGPARAANSDAVALSRYLSALGIETTPERLNDLLTLLSVLMIEAGGGLSLALGMALSGPASHRGTQDVPATKPPVTPVSHPGRPEATVAPLASGLGALPIAAADHFGPDIAAALHHAGGRVESLRKLADQIGRPRAAVTAECKAMVAAGLVTMGRGRHGYVVELHRPN